MRIRWPFLHLFTWLVGSSLLGAGLAHAVPSITFRGEIGVVLQDSGGVYSGLQVGTNMFGVINPGTGHGSISDGATEMRFTCCIAADGLIARNDEVLDAGTADLLNSLAGTNLAEGDVVDQIEISGDVATGSGGRIEAGIVLVLDRAALSDTDPFNYPVNPAHILATGFFVDEENAQSDVIFSAVGTAVVNVAGLVTLNDANQNNEAEVAVLRKRYPDQRGRIQIKEWTGANVRTTSYLEGFDPAALILLDDLNGNGNPELGVMQVRRSDGGTQVEIRDALTAATVNRIWFSSGFIALEAATLHDISGNNIQEIVVLQIRASDRAVGAQIRDASTKALIGNVWFRPGVVPLGLAIVPDLNGNQVDEIAALLLRKSDSRILVQIRDAMTGTNVRTIWHPPGFSARGIAVVNDVTGNGQPEIATLVERDSDGAVAVRLNDAATAASIRRIWFMPGTSVVTPVAVAVFGDTSGNGVQEVGAVMLRHSANRQLVQLRDLATGALARTIWLAPGYSAERLISLASVDGDGSDDVGVLGFSGPLVSQVRIYDSASGVQRASIPFPAPALPPSMANLSYIQENVFTPSCAVGGCHSQPNPQAGLDLSAGATADNLIGVASAQQPALERVEPGNPDDSYLVRKLEGGPGITGDRMPKTGCCLPQATIDIIRTWIAELPPAGSPPPAPPPPGPY